MRPCLFFFFFLGLFIFLTVAPGFVPLHCSQLLRTRCVLTPLVWTVENTVYNVMQLPQPFVLFDACERKQQRFNHLIIGLDLSSMLLLLLLFVF